MTWLVILNQSPFSWDDHLVVRSAQQLSFSTGPTEETLNRINIWKKRPGISNIINISPIATPKWKHWPHHHSLRHRYIHRHRRHRHDLLHHQPYVAIRWIEFGAPPYAKFVAVFQVAFAQICCGDVFIFYFFFRWTWVWLGICKLSLFGWLVCAAVSKNSVFSILEFWSWLGWSFCCYFTFLLSWICQWNSK